MAATIDFPASIGAPDYPLGESLEEAVLRSQAEDGSVQTRPKFTSNRVSYDVSWGHMTEEKKQVFENFYRDTTKNGALSFNWTHPSSGRQIVVRFTEPPSMQLVLRRFWSVSMKVQEVRSNA